MAGYNLRPLGVLHVGGYASAPEVPEASPVQTTLPTSAYGQTIPVIWGKARVPGAYIWVPPIVTVTSTHTEWWDTITETTSDMSCRLRFARPLVPDSAWTLRRLWSNGTLIYDASQNYRMKGLSFRFYDGRSTQGRDPTMTKEEGTNNVSAHRGYIDIVLKDFDIQGYGSPPVFEAEVIQDGGSTAQFQTYSTYSGSVSFDAMTPIWDESKLYGLQWNTGIQLYSIPATRQYFDFTLPADAWNYYQVFRYSRALDRIAYFGSFSGIGGFVGRMLDGTTGEFIDDASDSMQTALGACLTDISATRALLVCFSGSEQLYCYCLLPESFEQTYASGDGWNGYSSIQCIAPGQATGGKAEFYLCADSDLVKVTFNASGLLVGTSVVSSLTAPGRYVVYDDGDLVVWTDAATVIRVDGITGAAEYTKTVPYQIEVAGGTRWLGSPDLQRLTEELCYLKFASNIAYFTDLGTGNTRSVAASLSGTTDFYFYDGQTESVLTKNIANQPKRISFIAGSGDVRLLSDFLTDLMVYGGGYTLSDVDVENVDDLVQGAVVDITAGARDIAKAVTEPYSIALYERSGQIIFRRALTDSSFAVDQTISAAGDIVDQ